LAVFTGYIGLEGLLARSEQAVDDAFEIVTLEGEMPRRL